MDTDDRFKHLVSDPRFKTLRKKQHKVKIDERFQSMFTDERFTLKYSKDKRGKRNNKTSGEDLKKFYSLDNEDDCDKQKDSGKNFAGKDDDQKARVRLSKEIEDPGVKQGQCDIDEEQETENEHEEDDDDDEQYERISNISEEEAEDDVSDEELEEDSEDELSSSSDESESDEDDVDNDARPVMDMNNIQYDWQPLDHDAEKAETVTSRLAIQNLDWTHLDVKDIYTLVNSIRPPLNVRIYISEFGKERLAKEEVDGPQELAEMPQLDEDEEDLKMIQDRMNALEQKNSSAKTFKVNEYEDADEVLDMKNEEIRERIRRYQLSRMKYYYAIAQFDSPESAEAVYKELDGIEYEGSSLELDLRFVPDDMVFAPEDMQSECTKVPDLATYKAPQFINSALQQTTVKFTWDETDIKRQEKLQRAYTQEELDKDDLDAYLASDTEDEDDGPPIDDVIGDSKGGADKYRQLLKSLDEEAEKKKKVDVDVVWGDYEGDEMRTLASNKKDKVGAKSQTKSKSKIRGNKEDLKQSDDAEANADLDLLVMDAKNQEEFEFDPDDDRFGAVYESGLYNIDPSHPNFKRTQAFDKMAEKKREKRQKKRKIN